MPNVGPRVWAALAVAGALLGGGCASAQEVRWRHDYTAARREAVETGRPLLLDFGLETCGPCKRLDAVTFRDPTVAGLLNDRFVPVKVDGERNERLTQALGVDSFPTLVIAAPDGKVVGRHSGYVDAGKMAAFLTQAPAPRPPAPTVIAATPPTAPDTPTDLDRIHTRLEGLYPALDAALRR